MDDIINQDNNYILKDKEGTIWYFYLSENKKIMYTINRQNEWSNHEYIESQPIKSFSATMDSTGIIRIIAYTIVRQLLYFEWNKGKWNSQPLERIYSRFQDIPYFSIHSSTLGTHIICYINNSLRKSAETLIHYYLYEGKWHGGRLWKFMSDQMTMPQKVYIDHNSRLHMIFTQKWRQRIHLYYCIYDPIAFSWIEPIAIHSFSSPHQYQLIVDPSENLHLIWSDNIDDQYQIKYLSKLAEVSDQGWKEVIIHKSPQKIESPIIINNNHLNCFWKEDNQIYRMISKDSGITWSTPESLPDSLDYNTRLLNFISLDKGIPDSSYVWGQGYPNIKLAGINWHSVLGQGRTLEVSRTPPPDQEESRDWADFQRTISFIKRENRGLKEGINNLFSQIDQLHSIIYSLQDQMQINEKALFNITAQIKQLNFQIKQIQLRQRQTTPKIYGGQDIQYRTIPTTTDEKENTYTKVEKDEEGTKEALHIEEEEKEQEKEKETMEVLHIEDQDLDQEKEQEDLEKQEQQVLEQEQQVLEQEQQVLENEDPEPEQEDQNKDIQRISLGNTTILINPENPEDY